MEGATDGKTPKGAHHKSPMKGAYNSQHMDGDACLWRCAHPYAGIHQGGHTQCSMRQAVSASGDACLAVCGHSSCTVNFEHIINRRSMFTARAGDTNLKLVSGSSPATGKPGVYCVCKAAVTGRTAASNTIQSSHFSSSHTSFAVFESEGCGGCRSVCTGIVDSSNVHVVGPRAAAGAAAVAVAPAAAASLLLLLPILLLPLLLRCFLVQVRMYMYSFI